MQGFYSFIFSIQNLNSTFYTHVFRKSKWVEVAFDSWWIWREMEVNAVSFWTYFTLNILWGVTWMWKWSRHIQKDMFVEVGKGISPNFQQVLESLFDKGEYLAFAPDTNETKLMIDVLSIKFPLLKVLV